MKLYWNVNSLPELADLSPKEKTEAWRVCRWKCFRHWQTWLALVIWGAMSGLGNVVADSIVPLSMYMSPFWRWLIHSLFAIIGVLMLFLVAVHQNRPYLKAYVSERDMNKVMEKIQIITSQLDRDTILKVLRNLEPVLEQFWGRWLKGTHGAVSNVSEDKQWVFSEIKTQQLSQHILAEEDENFSISAWDYWIDDLNERESILLCHESDIHFEISSEEFANRIKEELRQLGIEYHVR